MVSRPGSGRPIDSKVLRPMTSGLPIVSALKRLRSLDSRHSRRLPRADDAVARDGGDDDEAEVGRGRAHTATFALIAGHGS